MINGVHLIYIIPPVALVIIAIALGWRQFSNRGAGGSLWTFMRVIVYGGLVLFVLFLLWVGMYYAGGGH